MKDPLLRVENLQTSFELHAGTLNAVDGVSFQANKGEIIGLIGESGSGKSVTALSIMRLVPLPGKILGGHVYFEGIDLLRNSDDQMRKIRGSKIAMSFQDPMTYLNPVMTVGDQIAESIIINQGLDKTKARQRAIEVMETVKIPMSSERVNDYPHQFSGGMRQRVLLAIAISCHPKLLIADEPTTALDIITQAEIIALLKELNTHQGITTLIISHNLGVIAKLAHTVVIMYLGMIMEIGTVEDVFKRSRHPYTKGLLETVPRLGLETLPTIKGEIPNPINRPSGCPFNPRCPYAQGKCQATKPPMLEIEKSHYVACFFPIMT